MNGSLSGLKLRNDLIWALTSPNLMALENNLYDTPSAQELHRWLQSDGHETRLTQCLAAARQKRLGVYFESLWRYFLEYHPDFELISCNLPVRSNGKTLGEFDFIYFCRRRQRYVHLETAVKFYLGTAHRGTGTSAWREWVGPGRKDRLDLKLNKMLEHQTQLSLTPEGARQIAELGITELLTEVCIKGYFFYPYALPCMPPAQSDHDHLRGSWLKFSALDQVSEKGAWVILDKSSWLSPASEVDSEQVYSYPKLRKKLKRHFAESRFPVMLALVSRQAEVYNERARYFVTDDNWPK